MANSYSICRRTWKWTNKLFFHLLGLNSYILLSHREFRLALVRNMLLGVHLAINGQGSNPCRFMGDISTIEGQTTSLADLLYFAIEVSCVLFAWDTKDRPDKVRELRNRTLHFRIF